MGFLQNIKNPQDLKKLSFKELVILAQEIREKIIEVVSLRGGHLSSSLGTVELIITLHYILNTPEDKIVWDVGHQAYAHKLITGRLFSFDTLRKFGGLSGFPNVEESSYDMFTVGHGSTAISQALGMVCARDLRGTNEKIVAVIGDGSLQGGMAFEALNQAGHLQKDILVILNDNEWFISPGIGAMSKYLNRILTNPIYNRIHKDVENLMRKVPRFGFRAYLSARKLEKSLKNLLVPGIIFEELGFRYFGPLDGHNFQALIPTLKSILEMKGPRIVHVVTKKGKGFRYAEENPAYFHSAPPFDVKTGVALIEKEKNFTTTFGEKILELAEKNPRVVAITAAMTDGTGLSGFAQRFPSRFFDVGMAEQHAVTFAGGLAKGGFIPVVAIYSTFLQRAYDQIIHDVCLQKLPVVFCLDRAGIVGEDGPTHHGVFDLSYLLHIPNMVVMAPKDFKELSEMLELAVGSKRTMAIRYPKGGIIFSREHLAGNQEITLGKAEILKEGRDLAILAVGSMVYPAWEAARMLLEEGVEAEVVNMRFIKPLDKDLLRSLTKKINHFVTVEENSLVGGFGAQVLSFFEEIGISGNKTLTLGLPDRFITHGRREEILEIYGLSPKRIKETVLSWLRGINRLYINEKNGIYQDK
ncbi:MAG: 1-deoxy-D-xylulose-5-phosphate synthase [Candidatus Omnitrophica bacterium]|nr:1-deoxy-D-xylulose-5-phosphate synthase [Candidatus Omnitrophota bacterium]